VLTALTAAIAGDSAATGQLTRVLDRYANQPDWVQLVDRLRRIHAGERDPDQLLPGLDPIDTAIVQRALDALAGRIQLSATYADQSSPGEGIEAFVNLVAAAAGGIADATTALTPILDEVEAEPGFAILADRIRRILAGERDADQLTAELDRDAAPIITAILDRLEDRTNP
jgi:hypothetical protein